MSDEELHQDDQPTPASEDHADAGAGADDVVNEETAEALQSAAKTARDIEVEADRVASADEVPLPDFGVHDAGSGNAADIHLLNDVSLKVKIELGRTRMYVEDVLRLNDQSVIELDKAAGDPVDIYVNERHIARGEVLVLNDNFCVRISEIINQPHPQR